MTEVGKPTTCARHPKVETALRCATCGTPICPRCMVTTPVGMKCRRCASGANTQLYQPSAVQMLLVGLVGAAAGAVAGWAVEFSSLGFLTLFLAIAFGGFAGEMVLRVCARKRGPKVEIPAGLGMILGAFGGRMIVAAQVLSLHPGARPPLGVWEVLRGLVFPSPIPLIALVIVIAGALGRVKSRW
jgi:hypothetical protein